MACGKERRFGERPEGLAGQRIDLEQIFDLVSEKLDADYEWEGDNLSFKRSGASGKVSVGKQDLEVDIRLSMLLTPLKGKIEQTVNDYLDENLA